eukprot:Em0001g2910a
METREEFLQLKSVVQELRSEVRKLQVDVVQRVAKLDDQLEASSFPALATSEPTPSAALSMQNLLMQCSYYVALEKTGSTGWNLKVEHQSFTSIATCTFSITISMSFTPHHVMTKWLELLYHGGAFTPGHVTRTPVGDYDHCKGRKNDYECVTVTDGTTWIRCKQLFLAKEVLLECGQSQEWLETTDFFIESNSTATWKNNEGVLSFSTSDSVNSYTTKFLNASALLHLAVRAKQTKKEEIVLENACFENSTASVKGYLVTDLDCGVPYAIKVDIKTQTSSSTGYYPLPHDYFDIGSPTLSVEPQKILVGEELTVKWALNRVSAQDKIVINSPHGESPIDDTYNTKAETTGVVKMKAPDTVGAYQYWDFGLDTYLISWVRDSLQCSIRSEHTAAKERKEAELREVGASSVTFMSMLVWLGTEGVMMKGARRGGGWQDSSEAQWDPTTGELLIKIEFPAHCTTFEGLDFGMFVMTARMVAG